MDEWLRGAARSVAERAGIDAQELELTSDEIKTLLDHAGVAAHESGKRTNAPLLCYLLGRASALSGIDAAQLLPRALDPPPRI
jgi:hypothetical protein